MAEPDPSPTIQPDPATDTSIASVQPTDKPSIRTATTNPTGTSFTTIFENGQTMTLPLQQAETDVPAQTGHAGDWAGLDPAPTGSIAPVVILPDKNEGVEPPETAEIPDGPLFSNLPIEKDPDVSVVKSTEVVAPEVAVTSSVKVDPPVEPTKISPPGSANTTSNAPPSNPTNTADDPAILTVNVPAVLGDNDKPYAVVVATSTSRMSSSTISPTSTNPPAAPTTSGLPNSPLGNLLVAKPTKSPLANTAALSLIPEQGLKSSTSLSPIQVKPTSTASPTGTSLTSPTTTSTTTTISTFSSDPSLDSGLTSSSSSSRTIWDLIGDATRSASASRTTAAPTTLTATGTLNTGGSGALVNGTGSVGSATGTATGGAIVGGLFSAPDTRVGESSSTTANSSPTSTVAPTLPPPGSPEEANVVAVISSSVTLTGTAAVAAIKAGATQLESLGGVGVSEKKSDGLNEFAIAGIVAGGLLVLIVMAVVIHRWRKRGKAQEEETQPEMSTRDRRDSDGFDFSDDPVTASTARMHRGTIGAPPAGMKQGPFADGYQSHYGAERESWYDPARRDQMPNQEGQDIDDGYPFFRNINNSQGTQNLPNHTESAYPATADVRDLHTDAYATTHQYDPSQVQSPDDLEMLYGDAINHEQARRELSNPFAPPVPPIPASVRQSSFSRMSEYPRPTTGMTDIYGAYDTSRSGTQMQNEDRSQRYDEYDDDRDVPMKTPATSSLLPWLDRGDTPPLPTGQREAQRQAGAPQNAEDQAGQYQAYERESERQGRDGPPQRPARPVMAQTPAGAGANGFNTMIPGFR